MTNAMIGHQPHAIFHRMRRTDMDHLAGKNFLHGRLLGRPAFERDLPGVVAFGKNADKLPLISHEQGPDILVRHQLDGIEDHRIRRGGPNRRAFMVQNFTDISGRYHKGVLRSKVRRGVRSQRGRIGREVSSRPSQDDGSCSSLVCSVWQWSIILSCYGQNDSKIFGVFFVVEINLVCEKRRTLCPDYYL